MHRNQYADPFTWPVPGMLVNHVAFGDGTVLAAEPAKHPESDPGVVTIEFTSGIQRLPAGTFAIVPS